MLLLPHPTRPTSRPTKRHQASHTRSSKHPAPSCMHAAPSPPTTTTLALIAAAIVSISTPLALAADSSTPETLKGAGAGGVAPADSPLIQELLARSKENKEKNDKERLDSYYRRNYKEYFEFVEGNLQRGVDGGLSEETKEGIRAWLDANR